LSLPGRATRYLVLLWVILFVFGQAVSVFSEEAPEQDPQTIGVPVASRQDLPGLASPPASDFLIFPETSQPPSLAYEDPYSLSLRIATSLALVIAAIFALSWFIQKKTGLAGSPFGKVVGVLPLDSRKYIYLVDIMGKMLILGVTEHHISFISEITNKADIDGLRLKSQSSGVHGLEKLFDFLKNKPDEDSGEPGQPPTELSGHSRRAQNSIRKMTDLLLERKKESPDD
jgi:flagellar biosynthetic protein FliO